LAKRWRKTELAYLERNAGTESIDDLAKRFKTDSESVTNKMSELGVSGVSVPGMDEAAIQRYASAVALLADHNWAKAADAFRDLIAAVDSRQLRAMAQQQLDICRRQLEGDNIGQDADPYLRAVFLKNRGQLDEALALCDGSAQDDERVAFLAASVLALQGDEERAIELLDAAIRLEPKNRVHAFHDPDFESIRNHEGFKVLIASR
jgi:tetratricopeptide (TPR) repeat protein